MIDLSGIEYDFLPNVLWVVIPLLVFAALAAVGFLLDWEETGVTGLAFFILWGLFGSLISLGAIPEGQVEEEEKARTVTQLEAMGFEQVTLRGKSFTASLDGAYFSGGLMPLGEYKYQVVEKKEWSK